MHDNSISYKNILLEFDKIGADNFFRSYIEKNQTNLLIEKIQNALFELGDDWEKDKIALSQLYMGGTITEELINKYFSSNNTTPQMAQIGIVTLGDFHILGKKIIKSVLQTSNINLLDLGHGLDPHQIIDQLQKKPLKLLLVSVLMYPTALEVKNLCELVSKNNIDMKIMVGGAPFNFDSNLWKSVGADAMGYGPTDAINYIHQLNLD